MSKQARRTRKRQSLRGGSGEDTPSVGQAAGELAQAIATKTLEDVGGPGETTSTRTQIAQLKTALARNIEASLRHLLERGPDTQSSVRAFDVNEIMKRAAQPETTDPQTDF